MSSSASSPAPAVASSPHPCDVFLFHSSADKPAVEQLARRLLDAGVQPWLDSWNLIPGDPWQEGLEEALDTSATCAVFLGPSGVGPWHNEELRVALDRRALPAHVIRYKPTLEGMTSEQVREIGGEIAFLGRRGLDINNPAPKYSLWTLLDDFSGMHLVSIIYAAFQQFATREDVRIDLVRNYDRALGMRGQWIGEGSSHMKVPTW